MKKNVFIYLISCVIFSLGATSFILSEMGTDPLDVFCLGMQKQTGSLIGTTQVMFAALCLMIWSALNRCDLPPVMPVVTFFLCGYMIDFFRYALEPHSIGIPSLFLALIGTLLCLQGSAGIIMSKIGIRAMDLVAFALEKRTGRPFWLYKGIAEMLLLGTGWLLGGPVGIGTIMFLFVVGWGIQPALVINRKVFNLSPA